MTTAKKVKSVFTPIEASRDLPNLCRRVIDDEERLYVKDKSGRLYMTLAPEKKYSVEPIVTVSAQKFKDHFGRFSHLVKSGMCFRLSFRGTGEYVYARRHQKYDDPLEGYMEKWEQELSRTIAKSLCIQLAPHLKQPPKAADAKIAGAVKAADVDWDKIAHEVVQMSIGTRTTRIRKTEALDPKED